MMTCELVRSQVQERLDGLLLPLDRAAFDAHAERCAGCRAELAAWRTLLASLEDAPPAEVPADFADRVMADLPEMLPAEEGAGHVVRWGIAVAAVVAVFLGSLGLLLREGGPEATQHVLAPLAASLQLGALLLTQLVSGIGAISASATAASGTTAIALVFAFAAVNVALASLVMRLRPAASSGGKRAS